MPAYVIAHNNGRHGDIHIEDPGIAVKLRAGWLYINDTAGELVLAVPSDQVASVQRIDEPAEDGAEGE